MLDRGNDFIKLSQRGQEKDAGLFSVVLTLTTTTTA